jgi:GT2 family glycosyltransferase/glycosyltransferase involved in cell wall biosynthesis
MPRTQSLLPLRIETSRLEGLFAGMASAVEEGRLKDAFRLADCTCRIAPANTTCRVVHARLLIEAGAASEAAERLRGLDEPDAVLARAEGLCAQGCLEDAAASVEDLLRRLAVDSVENLGRLSARLCRASSKFPGWIGIHSSLRLVGEVRNGIPVAIAFGGNIRHPTVSKAGPDGMVSFELDMPANASGQIAAFSGPFHLLGSALKWPPEFGFSGWVMLEEGKLVGKSRLDWAPALPTTLAIGERGGKHVHVSVPAAATRSTAAEFSVPLDDFPPDADLEVSAVLPDGTRWPLAGSPIPMPAASPVPIGIRPRRTVGFDKETALRSPIDIVVPVYAGLRETLLCLERVLSTTTRTEAELVVVNDASLDRELCEALTRLALDGRITLLTNASNLGFPGAANRGICLHPERDVVLLNSDTEVFGDWLDRLKLAAYSEADIGTVTPLGETGSIMSYPGGEDRPRSGLDAAEIDRIARNVNAGERIELPVGVGFCVYVKRACLDEIGGFDERTFGKGYGEENDFCLRARRRGWRHLGAADVFVGHPGGKSYGRSKEMLMERNRRVLNTLHPGYEALIADFAASDPLLPARRAIDTHRLLKQSLHPVLLVTSGLPGGVKRHVDLRQTELAAAGHTVLILKPSTDPGRADQVTLHIPGSNFENLAYNVPDETDKLRELFANLRLSHIEMHHFVGLPAAAVELVAGLAVPYRVYVHDYSWVCPRITLLGGNESYCGEPPVEECETCVQTYGTALEESVTVAALRTRSARILERANDVVVPANDVRNRLARYFPSLPIQVAAWEPPMQPRPCPRMQAGARIRVAVIGAIGIQKGHHVLLQCARDAAERNLELDFVVIGYTVDDALLLSTGRVFISGPYADSEIGALLEREQCQIALFPSVAPETWCYALTHAMNWGLPIVAFDLGAIAERLRGYGASQLLPLSTDAAEINDALTALARQNISSETQKELSMSDPSPAAAVSTANDSAVSQELEASAKILTLPVGVYSFSVQGGAQVISSDGLALPALQLGLAPMKSSGTVEFLAGAGTWDRWLTSASDTFIVRISGANVALLLTSVRLPTSSVLTINVQKIDTPPEPSEQSSQAAAGALGISPVQVMAHIENFGDIYFNDGRVGFSGQKLRIEAFAILSVSQLAPDLIEYCGVMADGYQTPWLSNQVLCGSRGRGMGLLGFAIRLKPQISGRYDCRYTGKFVSGTSVGSLKDGELCRSPVPDDPLEAIDIEIVERSASQPNAPGQGDAFSYVS